MLIQFLDDLLQSLYFPHQDNRILIVLAFIILISVGLIGAILLSNQKLNNRIKVGLLSISFIFGGLILGGVPNVVLVYQHIFADILSLNIFAFCKKRVMIHFTL